MRIQRIVYTILQYLCNRFITSFYLNFERLLHTVKPQFTVARFTGYVPRFTRPNSFPPTGPVNRGFTVQSYTELNSIHNLLKHTVLIEVSNMYYSSIWDTLGQEHSKLLDSNFQSSMQYFRNKLVRGEIL